MNIWIIMMIIIIIVISSCSNNKNNTNHLLNIMNNKNNNNNNNIMNNNNSNNNNNNNNNILDHSGWRPIKRIAWSRVRTWCKPLNGGGWGWDWPGQHSQSAQVDPMDAVQQHQLALLSSSDQRGRPPGCVSIRQSVPLLEQVPRCHILPHTQREREATPVIFCIM